MLKSDKKISVGLEYETLEYKTHWNGKRYTVQISNGFVHQATKIHHDSLVKHTKDWAMKTENTIITRILLCMLTTQDKHNLCCERVARVLGNLAQLQ